MVSMLTTQDNPFDPFTQFDEWYDYDDRNGYHCCQLLARVAHVSDELSNEVYESRVNDAINFLIEFDPFGILKKVTKNEEEQNDFLP